MRERDDVKAHNDREAAEVDDIFAERAKCGLRKKRGGYFSLCSSLAWR